MVKVKIKCKTCEKEFERNKSRIIQTCSKECFHKLLSKQKIGEKNPQFNNGWRQYRKYKPYSKKCEVCKKEKKLEVHHVDGNNKNNNHENLLRVCRFCHMLLDNRFGNLNYNNSVIGLCYKRGEE